MKLHPQNLALPEIPGLRFRTFNAETDYPDIVAINNICWPIDGREANDSVEGRKQHWEGMENFHAANVLIIAVFDDVIGYATISWDEESEQSRCYYIYATLLPAWRRRGIGSAIQNWIEARSNEINAQLPHKQNCYFHTYCFDIVEGKIALLRERGYEVAGAGYMMDRSLHEPIPHWAMPGGIEVRPVQSDQMRAVYEALMEGFKTEPTQEAASEEQIRDFLAYHGPDQVKNWQVAWDVATNELVAVVIAGIYERVSQRTGQKHGELESLSTRHQWRKRGIARALITRSLELFKAQGMGFATVGTHDDNVASNHLYASLGFRKAIGFTEFKKNLEER